MWKFHVNATHLFLNGFILQLARLHIIEKPSKLDFHEENNSEADHSHLRIM